MKTVKICPKLFFLLACLVSLLLISTATVSQAQDFTISGTAYQIDGTTPISGARVSAFQDTGPGNCGVQIDFDVTDAGETYSLTAPNSQTYRDYADTQCGAQVGE